MHEVSVSSNGEIRIAGKLIETYGKTNRPASVWSVVHSEKAYACFAGNHLIASLNTYTHNITESEVKRLARELEKRLAKLSPIAPVPFAYKDLIDYPKNGQVVQGTNGFVLVQWGLSNDNHNVMIHAGPGRFQDRLGCFEAQKRR